MEHRHMRYPGGKLKAVTFSYDDGLFSDIRLAEIFDKYGIKGTFNFNSSFIPDDSDKERIGVRDVKKYIIEKGHEVANHGYKHIPPAAASPIEAIKDVLFCRIGLEEKFNMIVRGMAYPSSGILAEFNGNTVEKVKAQLSDLGIVYARTLGGDNDEFKLPYKDWLAWMPTAHHENPHIFEYIDKFLSINVDADELDNRTARWPRLFFIWGHSSEFDKRNNWDRIEKICELLSGKDDTWYATNIEIYDYVKAYEQLVFGAGGTMVYNPTRVKLWFEVDKVLFNVEPGETVRITA